MTQTPLVSLIIPHYRDLVRLDLCLAALERQTLPRDDFEIVVADNGSPEGEVAVAVAIAGRARLVVVTERGAGPARNVGVAAARGDILAFTDSDCIPEPSWLAEGLAALHTFDFVGGRVKVLVPDERRMTGAEAFELVFAFDNEAYVNRKGFTVTANLFCTRPMFDTVGGFRVGVSEDKDWSQRAGAAGYRIGYAAGAVVGHPARRSWDELTTKWRRLNAEQFGLIKDRPLGRWRWLARNCLAPASALVHTPKVLRSPALMSRRQRLDALAMLYRLRFWRLVNAAGLLTEAGR